MQQYYSGNRRNGLWQMSPVNTIIIVINVVVFAVLTFLGDTTDLQFMYHHGANFWPSVIEEHEYYRLLTCTFIHFGISHLFNNMLVLAYIWRQVLARVLFQQSGVCLKMNIVFPAVLPAQFSVLLGLCLLLS